ncbi:DUF4876 domain-containing protein [Sphingobacterium bambusae]|uniref:DUF4876 domain-containing protein n=1 Tax=Sphingobacterium bambusae TaxID=662858 RepID=A0ABW6BN30_9SPHI|nr:DUF4876 domain-containing protein [Sphingobacterium bambusae]WPL48103.1 DUF4876 domain-containing protein [Sphingobacterium bambusae]
MHKLTIFRFLFFGLLIMLGGCQRDVFPENKPVDIQIKASFLSEEYGAKLPLDSIVVSVFDPEGRLVFRDSLQPEGTFSVKSLAPNAYTLQATAVFKKEYFNDLFDLDEDFDVSFSSQATRFEINESSSKEFELGLLNGSYGALVIKQIYYAGSHATQGASFRDQFIEIYNNSEIVQYADSLYIAEAFGANSKSTNYVYLPNSMQYDWSKSYGMPSNIKANEDYVYAATILRIPGSGTDYPILPGESIVLAATAANHKSPYQGTDGKTISVQNPDLTVDLSQADFEAHYATEEGVTRPLASDVDNPNVPNVVVVRRSNGTDLIMSQTGQDSWIIFRDAGMGEVKTWKTYDRPYTDGRVTTAGTYVQIPVANIIDAVELQSSTSTQYPKRLNAKTDAGFIAVTGGQRSSNSVIRKTKEIVNGRRILKDSNNSTEDFTSMKAAPKGFAD